MYHLDGQVAIVTGAGSGLGRAIGLRLSQEGAIIVAADLNGEAAEKLVAEIKDHRGSGLSIQMDVSVEKDVERTVKEALQHFGRIDILVNNEVMEIRG
jgi:NAD(P)-dependent dehydrogenase (short-subunit alcohol dehydrogenase family)